jgi:hypothetical protein
MHEKTLSFNRDTGALTGASISEQLAAMMFAVGARASAPMHWRGFSVGCRAVRSIIGQREVIVQLNPDACFAFPFGDGYWSLLLDRSFVYESEIELFLRSIADVDYCFIDGGANFGYWSALAGVSSGHIEYLLFNRVGHDDDPTLLPASRNVWQSAIKIAGEIEVQKLRSNCTKLSAEPSAVVTHT